MSENEADKLLRETLEDGPADRLYAFLLRVEAAAIDLMRESDGGHEGGNGSSGGTANGAGRGNGSGAGQRFVASGQGMAPEPRALLEDDDRDAGADRDVNAAPIASTVFAGMATEAAADCAGSEHRPTVN